MDYVEFNIMIQPRDPWAEILSAELTDLGFESFIQEEENLLGYLPIAEDKPEIIACLQSFQKHQGVILEFNKQLIKGQNWNAAWENSFEPVLVEQFCSIRAPFHEPPLKHVLHDIIIMPKMSFGTGHHPTTFLMVKAIQKIDLKGMTVLDMGCGTGVLGILAKKVGAKEVLGIDIETWAVENAKENATGNQVEMEVKIGSVAAIPSLKFDCVLANINRNVLCEQLPYYGQALKGGGHLLLSGFMEQDVAFLKTAYEREGFKEINVEQKENWVCIHLRKQ